MNLQSCTILKQSENIRFFLRLATDFMYELNNAHLYEKSMLIK